MTVTQVVAVVAALLGALFLAWWPWRGALSGALPRLALAARFMAILALLLLLLDPGVRAVLRGREPLVLLDNSVSMHGTGGRADSATALAASLGDVITFGEAAPGEPGGPTTLGEALAAAVGAGRPIVVISDGEVADVASVPADLLAQAGIRLLPRPTGPDAAITDARLPERIAAGDTLVVDIAIRVTPDWQDSVRVEVRDGDRLLLAGTTVPREGRALLSLAGAVPAEPAGERWLEIAIAGGPDREPLNDVRVRRLIVTPSPGIVVIAQRPDWDARFLYSTLAAVTAAPVRGYIQLTAGSWRRMDNLRSVPTAEVAAAARQADLVAVRGDTTPWRASGGSRLLWPAAATPGDWYLAPAGPSPLAGAFAGLDADSLPPLPAVSPVPSGEWIALEARQARRGTPVPVVAGHRTGGRTVVIGVEGLHRWAFRGGDADQAWRTMIGEATGWLLAAPPADAAPATPLEPVAQRGRPLRFRRTGSGALPALPVTFTSDSTTRADTLRFDADGIATVVLPPGRYRYQFADGAPVAERVAVERYSDELFPAPVTLTESAASAAPTPVRRSLRDLLPLFGLAILGFSVEWVIRRRLGMR